MNTLPVQFISHGAPPALIDGSATGAFFGGLGRTIPRPRAILCISAHWTTDSPRVSAALAPKTIHDFYGFADELYEMKYPAPGAPELAERVAGLLSGLDAGTSIDPHRGLDHGAWVPLYAAYPDADIPVTQLSVQSKRDPAWHLELGRRLQPLRGEGVLVLASGGATHNLGDWGVYPVAAAPVPYAVAFNDWLVDAVEAGEIEELLDVWKRAPEARRNHPTPEHLLPLFVALGCAGGVPGRCNHIEFTYGVLSMAAFTWD